MACASKALSANNSLDARVPTPRRRRRRRFLLSLSHFLRDREVELRHVQICQSRARAWPQPTRESLATFLVEVERESVCVWPLLCGCVLAFFRFTNPQWAHSVVVLLCVWPRTEARNQTRTVSVRKCVLVSIKTCSKKLPSTKQQQQQSCLKLLLPYCKFIQIL